MKLALNILCLSLVSVAAFAQTPTGTNASTHEEGPCKKIKDACIAGGYLESMHKKDGKGLYVDCMQPLLSGKTVAGVTVAPADIQACEARRAKHQARKAQK